MGADTQHDEPFWILSTYVVGLRVTQCLDVDTVGLLNLVRGAVTDEDRLAAPFDDDVLALGDSGQVELDLGECENICGCGHGAEEVGHTRLCGRCGDDTHRANHKVRNGTVGRLVARAVVSKVRHTSGLREACRCDRRRVQQAAAGECWAGCAERGTNQQLDFPGRLCANAQSPYH